MTNHRILLLAILTLLSAPVSASEVTIPNEFVAGQKARANDVNENFEAVKDAVDDNHDRITALESQVVETGAVSVSAHAFNGLGTCTLIRAGNFGYFQDVDTICMASASVSLPHGATITGSTCMLSDADPAANIQIHLYQSSIASTTAEATILSGTATSDDPFVQLKSMAGPGGVVDNTLYAYYIKLILDSTDLVDPTELGFLNCNVSYTLPD
jgi:hypothetical protein